MENNMLEIVQREYEESKKLTEDEIKI